MKMGDNNILLAENLSKSYEIAGEKKAIVLKGLSVKVNKGELVALMGPSGAGKSTLLHILGSLDQADEGNIVLSVNGDVYDYSKISSEEFTALRNRHIGFIFQFHHLLPEFTALENVMMPALIAGMSYKEASVKAQELIKIVGIAEQQNQKPSELSGGEQQRAAIARALINNPAIVFADEPTGNLDKSNADAVLELLLNLKKKYSKTFVIATHSPEVAASAERILRMSDGKIIEDSISV
ncbi:MAG: ABC transporter ATP-binding protein [bacterium]